MTSKEKKNVPLTEDIDSAPNVTGHTHLVAFNMSLWSIHMGLSDRTEELQGTCAILEQEPAARR